jgi:WD40 repeat protein
LAMTSDHLVKIWDVSTRTLLQSLAGHSRPVRAIAFSPDGRTLATSGDDHVIKLWDLSTKGLLLSMRVEVATIRELYFRRDSHELLSIGHAADGQREVHVWRGQDIISDVRPKVAESIATKGKGN